MNIFVKTVEHEIKNAYISSQYTQGKKWMGKVVWKLNSHQNINILVSDSNLKYSEMYVKLHNSAVIENLRK